VVGAGFKLRVGVRLLRNEHDGMIWRSSNGLNNNGRQRESE
jgi:hypothetical protein